MQDDSDETETDREGELTFLFMEVNKQVQYTTWLMNLAYRILSVTANVQFTFRSHIGEKKKLIILKSGMLTILTFLSLPTDDRLAHSDSE